MQNENIISGKTEDEVWQQLNQQLTQDNELLEYTAIVEQEKKRIVLDIDIDLGGGFESGYETTTFSAVLHTSPAFRFAIHHEHFIDEIGKFFGMEDVETGFAEFDKKLIVKTNDKQLVTQIFSDAEVRNVFEALDDFTFGIAKHDAGGEQNIPFLELQIEAGITDPAKLRELYHAFYKVLVLLDKAAIS